MGTRRSILPSLTVVAATHRDGHGWTGQEPRIPLPVDQAM
jgi:hypothetical protein